MLLLASSVCGLFKWRQFETDRQTALTNLVRAIREYGKLADEPMTLRGSSYPHAVKELK
jgi:hypothetical protein